MTDEQYYCYTPRTFNNILVARRQKEQTLSRESWEQTRAITVAILRPHLAEKDRKKPIDVLWSFPWDSEAGKPKEDPIETFKKSKAMWAAIDEKRKLDKKDSDVEQSG